MLLLVSLLVALFVGATFALDGYREFGLSDALISFGAFGILTFISLSLGCLSWWFIRLAHMRNE